MSCTSGLTCKELSFQVGSVHNVNEPNPPANWGVIYSGCSNMTVSATDVRVCTVTNTATQNPPDAVTRQLVKLFDRATVGVVHPLRRLTSNEPAMAVTFTIYPNASSCDAKTGGLGTETVSIPANQSATSVSVGTTTGIAVDPGVAFTGNSNTVRYWRAVFHQDGTNPPNADFTTPCTEITTVNIQQ